MNIWNDGDHFSDKSIDYAIWTDKLTIRKGNEGWQITELVNSLAGAVKYIQVITYKNEQGGWKPKKILIGSVGQQEKENKYTIWCSEKDNQISSSRAEKENKFLKFWVNGVTWYLGKEVSNPASTDASNEKNAAKEDLSEVFRESKSGSWIWSEDANKQTGLLKNFGSLQYSKYNKIETYRLNNCHNLFFGNNKELKMDSANLINQLYHEINNTWNNKGQWINTEEVCGLANKRKWSVNEDQRKNLKLFCAKPKSEE